MAAVKLVQNICGSTTRSNIAKVGLGYSLNMYSETQDVNEHSCQMLMRAIDGEKIFAEIAGKCRGMYRVSRGINDAPALYAVYDDKLYYIDANRNVNVIGTVDSYNTKVNMCETGGYGDAHPHLILTDGLHVYAVNTGLAIADQQNDFRAIKLPLRNNKLYSIQPTHCAYLYGYLIVNDKDTDNFYVSYQYPFEAYASNEKEYNDVFMVDTEDWKDIGKIVRSEWMPDNTLALCSNGSKLYTFGTRSWQVFSYNNDINYPFSSPDNAAGNIGIKAVDSLAMLGRDVIFLGSSDVGENGVFKITDTTIERISTNDIEREIMNLPHPEKAYAQKWQEHQHVFYALTFEEGKQTFVYDLTENAWHNRQSYDSNNRLTYWRYSNATFAYNRVFVAADNVLCYMDENYYLEHDKKPILKMRRGACLTATNCPFYIDGIELIVNNGQHSFNNTYTNMELNPRVTIRYSWDGSTWSDYEDGYMGKIGEYDYSTTFYQFGLGKYFTLEISTTEAIPFCIENIKVQYCPTSNFI